MYMYMRARVCACVHVCVRVCVRARMRACAFVCLTKCDHAAFEISVGNQVYERLLRHIC